MNQDLVRRVIKMADVSLTGVYFLAGAMVISTVTNMIFGDYVSRKYNSMSIVELSFNVAAHSAAVVMAAYLLRNLIEMIPFPLDGKAGYVHGRIKELQGGVILMLALTATQQSLIDKIRLLYQRMVRR